MGIQLHYKNFFINDLIQQNYDKYSTFDTKLTILPVDFTSKSDWLELILNSRYRESTLYVVMQANWQTRIPIAKIFIPSYTNSVNRKRILMLRNLF